MLTRFIVLTTALFITNSSAAVEWDSPSENSWGSMPLGNGDIGINAWVEASTGDLLLYLSKTDAWSENNRLLKLGRVRLRFGSGLLTQPFRQTLDPRNGWMTIESGEGDARLSLRVWVDANHPTVRIESQSETPSDLLVTLEVWRNARRQLEGTELGSAFGLHGANPSAVFVEPDFVIEDPTIAGGERVVWYHRNERSIWAANLRLQSLGGLTDTENDPLLHRTFGAAILGEGLVRRDPITLSSDQPRQRHRVTIHPLTAQTPDADGWLERLGAQVVRDRALDWDAAAGAHTDWWAAFQDRSHITVEATGEDARAVNLGYLLQRYIQACAGRGAFPIKFNGSLFTVDLEPGGILKVPQGLDADFRLWGGPYWWQNTRLPYWSMLASGDFDLMRPLFEMYRRALALAQERVRTYYGHSGAIYPETMTFWGTYADENYGWDRSELELGLAKNLYIRRYWQGALELTAMMLAYHAHTDDQAFARETLLPIAEAIVAFYDEHYPRDAEGLIRFEPAQSLETFHVAVNPLPEVAGLRYVLPQLLALDASLTTADQRERWTRLLGEMPPVPLEPGEDGPVLAPAAEYEKKSSNQENPGLYAVFPYRLYGLGKADLDVALRTFEARAHRGTGGWFQTAIQAALLGRADTAREMVVENFTHKHVGSRFPAFWGPNYDWVPDQDHGAVAVTALQWMLLQSDGDVLRVLPAWPSDWPVSFKLHGPSGAVVEGRFAEEKLELIDNGTYRRDRVIVPQGYEMRWLIPEHESQ